MAKYKVKVGGQEYDVTVTDTGMGARVTVDGETFDVEPAAGAAPPPPAAAATSTATPSMPAAPAPVAPRATGGSGSIAAPIPGVVTELCVRVGDTVAANQVVLKLEAMKMENDIATPVAGTVKEIAIGEGAEVKDGQLLMVIG